ncbi:MAG: RHS repeat-associated core domain-containing protein [Hyphomicrobiaceae bacterium]|nr:RHS repeat-associated core domain-containing protein [Hyphomicrobiaceae bacterium]
MYYNWHRQYDPKTGRYTQPDPLGLGAGISRYAYVTNDPLQKVDPGGLATTKSFPYACVALGLDPTEASDALHDAKKTLGCAQMITVPSIWKQVIFTSATSALET